MKFLFTNLKFLLQKQTPIGLLIALVMCFGYMPKVVWSQCASTVNATILDNATTNPFTYTGLAGGQTMTITNTTDNVVNVTTNSGYRLGASSAADRVYKITFLKPVSCATLYFSEMDNTTASERLAFFSTNDSLATTSFTNTSTGGSSNTWDAINRAITAGSGSTGSSSSSRLTFTANVAFTEIYFLYDRLSNFNNPGGVLLTQVDFTESTIAPVSACLCGDALNCGLNQYTNETTAFSAYDGLSGTFYDLRSQNLLHSIPHAYPMCVDYTTGPTETRLAVRHLVYFTNTCAVFSRAYSVQLKSDCATSATFLGANLTGGTRNFQFYDVQPNTTYRLCATVSLSSPCHLRTTGEFQPEYTGSSWYTYNASLPTSFTYPFNCTGSTVNGVFIANAVTGQTGTVTIPINITSAGSATFTVTGTNISGSLTTTLVSGQSSVIIPITYTGAGTEGSRVLTISSTSGTGTCSVSVPIQAACKADGGRIGN